MRGVLVMMRLAMVDQIEIEQVQIGRDCACDSRDDVRGGCSRCFPDPVQNGSGENVPGRCVCDEHVAIVFAGDGGARSRHEI